MSTPLHETVSGITYDLADGGDGSMYVRHFTVACERPGYVLPPFSAWAIVEREDYALYIILEPKERPWPSFTYLCSSSFEGFAIERMIGQALDAYAIEHFALCRLQTET